jgi:uncharacterized membrane protein YeiB
VNRKTRIALACYLLAPLVCAMIVGAARGIAKHGEAVGQCLFGACLFGVCLSLLLCCAMRSTARSTRKGGEL